MALEELRLTGGFNSTLVTYLQDDLGDLDGAVVKAALVPEGDSWPASGSALWKVCTVSVADNVATVSQQLTDAQAPGHYHWWLWVQDGAANTVVLVMDPDEPDRPWHIWVH